MQVDTSPRLMRRLAAAEGYLDLEMPEQALRELDAITEPGAWEATVEYLTGEALVAQRKFDEAIPRLKRAAELIPAPHGQEIWESLSDCYQARGDAELAELTRLFAHSTSPEARRILEVLSITISLEENLDALIEELDDDPSADSPNDPSE